MLCFADGQLGTPEQLIEHISEMHAGSCVCRARGVVFPSLQQSLLNAPSSAAAELLLHEGPAFSSVKSSLSPAIYYLCANFSFNFFIVCLLKTQKPFGLCAEVLVYIVLILAAPQDFELHRCSMYDDVNRRHSGAVGRAVAFQ